MALTKTSLLSTSPIKYHHKTILRSTCLFHSYSIILSMFISITISIANIANNNMAILISHTSCSDVLSCNQKGENVSQRTNLCLSRGRLLYIHPLRRLLVVVSRLHMPLFLLLVIPLSFRLTSPSSHRASSYPSLEYVSRFKIHIKRFALFSSSSY